MVQQALWEPCNADGHDPSPSDLADRCGRGGSGRLHSLLLCPWQTLVTAWCTLSLNAGATFDPFSISWSRQLNESIRTDPRDEMCSWSFLGTCCDVYSYSLNSPIDWPPSLSPRGAEPHEVTQVFFAEIPAGLAVAASPDTILEHTPRVRAPSVGTACTTWCPYKPWPTEGCPWFM